MPRIFGTIILALAVLLFPPSVLALISNNTVPGDITYPIKIKLEEGIVFLTSVNPQTKIWFSVTRSDRRFQEASVLLSRGEAASQTLTELVIQTDVAAAEISQITDQTKKQEFITNLQQSIQKYDDGLAAIQERQIAQVSPTPAPAPTSTPTLAPTPTPTATPLPTPAAPKPQPTVAPTPTPPIPSMQPISKPVITTPPQVRNEEGIKAAREKLEEIKKKLKEEQRSEREGQSHERPARSEKKDQHQDLLPQSSENNTGKK